MHRPSWVPAEVDLSRPSAARVYDYYLGGSHNLEVDRRMAREAISLWPDLPAIMQSNRAFLRRSVRYLAGQGITQFLDIGSGIPTVGNVHEAAQQADPRARVVYVDSDPVAVAHSRAILAGDEHTAVVHADLREPETFLEDPTARATLDLDQPIAVLMVAVLHFVSDEDDPFGAVARAVGAATTTGNRDTAVRISTQAPRPIAFYRPVCGFARPVEASRLGATHDRPRRTDGGLPVARHAGRRPRPESQRPRRASSMQVAGRGRQRIGSSRGRSPCHSALAQRFGRAGAGTVARMRSPAHPALTFLPPRPPGSRVRGDRRTFPRRPLPEVIGERRG
jgi:hypothetical protein